MKKAIRCTFYEFSTVFHILKVVDKKVEKIFTVISTVEKCG